MGMNCAKCGRKKYNSSRLCYKCIDKLKIYINQHPLSAYDSPTLMRKENENRWNNFINEGKIDG